MVKIEPYRNLGRVGSIAYELELPPELELNQEFFYMSMLIHFLYDLTHIVHVEKIEVRLYLMMNHFKFWSMMRRF
ncbi:hypothetical protein GQ457_12G016130 [Hibiscus cannabinus]